MTSVCEDPRDFWRQTSQAEDYDRGRFDSLRGRVYRRLEERTIRRVLKPLERGSRILDAACGTGRITALLLRGGFVPVGCDISVPMMSVARRHLARVPFLQSDAACLPFADNSFDAVTCVGLLMHLDGDMRVKVLRELSRISRRPLVVQYCWVSNFLRLRKWATGQEPGGVRHAVPEAELRRDLQRSGLTELARFWVLRPFSSSLILLLSKSGNGWPASLPQP